MEIPWFEGSMSVGPWTSTIGIFSIFMLIQACVSISKAHFSPLRNVPGPFMARYSRSWEFFHVAHGNFHRKMIDLHMKYGPVVRLGPNKFSFNSAQAVKTIYSMTRVFPKASYYDAFADPGTERALFNSRDNQQHARLKRTQASLYSMTTIKSYEPFVDTQTAVLEQKLREFSKTREIVSLPQFMQKYAFDVIGKITFGESFHLMEQSSDKLGVIDLVGKSLILSSALGIFPEFWSVLVGLLKMMRLPSPKVLFDVSSKFLSQHKQSGKLIDEADETSPATFTDKIISLQSKGKMNDWDALSVCVNNVIAGSDTTAISLNSAIYHIYKDSRILQTLRAELDSGMRQGQVSDPITFAEAQKLPYLQAVINEALRVHPAVGVPLLRDVPQGGADIDGYFFPEGTEVGVSAWTLNYNKDVYGPDAECFRPERWFENSIGTTSSAISQFVFGGGSRTCIGKNISMLEMTKVLPQIVRKFDISIEPKTSPWSLSTHWFVWQEYNSKVVTRAEVNEQDAFNL